MVAFADVEALNAYSGEQWDAVRASQALQAATATIQAAADQLLVPVADEVIELDPNRDGTVYLPEMPVTAVSSVELLVPDPVTAALTWTVLDPSGYGWNRRGRLYLTRRPRFWPSQQGSVRVTYSHGYEPIPDPLTFLCLDLALRLLENPTKLLSQNIGGIGAGYGTAALTDTECAIIGRYSLLEVG